jgi:hypothetical protein
LRGEKQLLRLVGSVGGILFRRSCSRPRALVFAKACELGLEGPVLKRAGRERYKVEWLIAEHGDGGVPRARDRESDRRSVRGRAAMIRISLTAESLPGDS